MLTGLPNRRLLMERIDQLIASAQAGAGYGAFMFIDLDNFKFINDAGGHALLRNTADRLSRLVRNGDTMARIGGDEFVVLLAQLGADSDTAIDAALTVAEKIRHAITETFEIDGQSYNASASIGVTLLPKPGQRQSAPVPPGRLCRAGDCGAGRNRGASPGRCRCTT